MRSTPNLKPVTELESCSAGPGSAVSDGGESSVAAPVQSLLVVVLMGAWRGGDDFAGWWCSGSGEGSRTLISCPLQGLGSLS